MQIFACTTNHPVAAECILHQAKLGGLLGITGTLTEPDIPGTSPYLRIHTADILDVVPLTIVSGTVLEHYGNYALVFDADRSEVPMFTTAGRWVGEATTPEGIGHLIRAFENTTPDPPAIPYGTDTVPHHRTHTQGPAHDALIHRVPAVDRRRHHPSRHAGHPAHRARHPGSTAGPR
ncbi:hypothetical protein PV409_32580 [Streptomyces sp. ME02-6979.5a]|uniref:hypothetical protein n=1 Tax=Streptomyces sp. ME02-6979.5a TaxID=462925 RepID=UPI0029A9C07E|nr:hypothetical protein [Streptomyces sp. ME02-6979.5a]MDX3342700.1 hypothetical protein [Streptomyces sp. ME02-6979.5a]